MLRACHSRYHWVPFVVPEPWNAGEPSASTSVVSHDAWLTGSHFSHGPYADQSPSFALVLVWVYFTKRHSVMVSSTVRV